MDPKERTLLPSMGNGKLLCRPLPLIIPFTDSFRCVFTTRYPLLIDAVMQSMGHGFVGTTQSTMSIIAARRVEAWQHGATRLFLFGRKGADDHEPQLKNARTIPNNRFY